MAEIKISELTSGSALSGTEVVPIVQSGATVKVTTQDIADLGGGGGTNPTSTYIPYNDGGAFVDSGFSYNGPALNEKSILVHNDGSNDRMTLDSFNGIYSFGSAQGISGATTNGGFASNLDGFAVGNAASASVGAVSAYNGLAIDGVGGEAIIGCGMSSPSNGVIRASSASGGIWMSPYGVSYGVGFNTNTDSMLIGSSLVTPASPSNPTTPVAWYNITNEFGVQFFAPLYQ